jgi:CBS domain-containing protein
MKNAEDILNEKGSDIIYADEGITILEALKIMTEKSIGGILVKRDDKIVGIWTERDLMRNTLVEGFDPKTARLGDYMVTDLRFASAKDSVYLLMDKFLGLRIRHLLIEKDGKFIGVLSPGDAIKTILHEKTKELMALNAEHCWEYYEDWQWRKRFKKMETPGQPIKELS